MNSAKYIGLDVHRATILVTVLDAAVCAALASKRKSKFRGRNEKYGVD
jgi:hypothetical protein